MTLVNAGIAKEHATSSGDAHLFGGNRVRFRKDFIDATALDSFDVVTGTGMVVTSASGNLTVTTGTTANQTTTITSKQMFTVPFKTSFGFKISQKIANQEFYVEIVACDPVTGVVDETAVAAWRVSGTDSVTATIARYEVRNGGATRLQSANVSSLPTQTADSIFEIVLESDEVWFHARAMDATTGRTSSNARQSVVPSPSRTYKLRYRIVNGSTAPASTTTFTSAFIVGVDYTEIQAEVTGSSGSAAAGQALPVAVTSAPTTAVTLTSTAIAALATVVGTTPSKILSAASTNATLIKGSAGRVYGYQLANTTAAWKFVRLYNKATAPVPGTDTPVMVIAVPPNGTTEVEMTVPASFATGIGYSITGASPDLDATAVAVGDVIGTILWL